MMVDKKAGRDGDPAQKYVFGPEDTEALAGQTGFAILKELEETDIGEADAAAVAELIERLETAEREQGTGIYDMSGLVSFYDEQQQAAADPEQKAQAKRSSSLAKAIEGIAMARADFMVQPEATFTVNPMLFAEAENSVHTAGSYLSPATMDVLRDKLYEVQETVPPPEPPSA
jgi:hypothetical protein